MEPKDRDLIMEQLYVKEIEFEDETKSLMVQVPEQIIEEAAAEEFVTVKGEFENKTVEEKDDMEIKELAESILAVSVKLDKMDNILAEVAEIKSFITNLTKDIEFDIDVEEKEVEVVDEKSASEDNADDLYKETLSQADNKEIPAEEKADGLSPEDEEIIKQVIANLKNLNK
jgi:hypothetical protein